MSYKLPLAHFSAAVLICTPTTGHCKSNSNILPSELKINTNINLEKQLDTIRDFDNLGDSIRLNDLKLTDDILWGLVGGQILLEEDSNLLEKIYIGVHTPSKRLILFVIRKSVLPNQMTTQKSTYPNLPEISLDRYRVTSLKVDNTTLQMLSEWSEYLRVYSAELSNFKGPEQKNFRTSNLPNLNSYANLVSLKISQALSERSHMDPKESDSPTLATAPSIPKFFGVYTVYGNAQKVIENPADGISEIYTVGTSRPVYKGNGSLKFSRKIIKGDEIQERVGVGYAQDLHTNVRLGGEAILNKDKVNESEVWATVSLQTKDREQPAQEIFPTLASKKKETDKTLISTPKKK